MNSEKERKKWIEINKWIERKIERKKEEEENIKIRNNANIDKIIVLRLIILKKQKLMDKRSEKKKLKKI